MGSAAPKFGHDLRSHFLFRPDYVNLNHGSFGTFPVQVRDALRAHQTTMEEAPDQFLRFDCHAWSAQARGRIAQLLNTSPEECVFVQNATLGVNTVLRNLRFRDKDCVVYFDTIYGACEKTLFSLCETTPLTLRKVDNFTLPCSHDDIVTALEETLALARADGLTPRVCLFETITSMPAARFPFERITALCRRQNILSLIDGAHGVGQLDLDLRALDPDFFVSNCHKWLYTPRGCAVFYVPRRNQHLIRTTFPTSWGFEPLPADDDASSTPKAANSSSWATMFSYVGTADTCAYFCVPAALDFRETVCGGEAAIRDYCFRMAREGAALLADRLHTKVMDFGDGDPKSPSIRDCAMANVLLPVTIVPTDSATSPADADPSYVRLPENGLTGHLRWMVETLVSEYNVAVSISPYKGHVWLRVSGQVYLELADFEWFAGVLTEVLDRVRRGDSMPKS